jgi:hypothetical protein
MSNRDRIARAAEEAELAEAQKAAKKAAEKSTGRTSRRTEKAVRMKVVWEICNVAGKTVKSFPYSEKAAAEAESAALARSTGRPHVVRAAKVPMD